MDNSKIESFFTLSALLILAGAAVMVVQPFLAPVLLAVILTIASWPLQERLTRLLNGRASISAIILLIGFTLTLVLPVIFLLWSIGAQVPEAVNFFESLQQRGKYPAPRWLHDIPLVGAKLAASLETLSTGSSELLAKLNPYAISLTQRLLSLAASLGIALGNLCITLLITFFFLRDGLRLQAKLQAVMKHLAGTRARELVVIAGHTLKGVVYGVVGTALLQAFLAWIGFVIVGVPAPALLTLATFFLAFIPIGPPLIWIPIGIWLLSSGETALGIFMFIWGGVVISGSDNLAKPYLISQGSDLPMILIFLGVFGGALEFGFQGIFLGPTILALAYSLINGWMETRDPKTGISPNETAVECSES